jgi:hypothetical protein
VACPPRRGSARRGPLPWRGARPDVAPCSSVARPRRGVSAPAWRSPCARTLSPPRCGGPLSGPSPRGVPAPAPDPPQCGDPLRGRGVVARLGVAPARLPTCPPLARCPLYKHSVAPAWRGPLPVAWPRHAACSPGAARSASPRMRRARLPLDDPVYPQTLRLPPPPPPRVYCAC